MNGRTIRTQGRAVVAAEPDLAILNFRLEARNYDYERSILDYLLFQNPSQSFFYL